MAKKRLDLLVVERGLAQSRQKAQALIMAGQIFSGSRRLEKAGMAVEETTPLELHGQPLPYVGRGGLKLEKALKEFSISLTGKIAADIGASTGGFTDCMLQNGAQKVYAVDVGYGDLAWKLRSDPRVVVLERTNARYLTHEQIPEMLDFASVDVSFISLRLIFPALRELMNRDGYMVHLVKPQFEAGRELVGKKGIVRDAKVHRMVLEQYCENLDTAGFCLRGLTYSPVTGQGGNIEFLGFASVGRSEPRAAEINICSVVEQAHAALKE